MIKYAVFNPATGEYVKVDTEQERTQQIAKVAWEFFLSHAHSVPYSFVRVNDDGSEEWTTPPPEEFVVNPLL